MPECPGEQGKGRGDRLLDQVADGVPDQIADVELRIAQRSGDRDVDVDLTLAVLQQRNRKLHRQVGGGVVLDLFAEGELVDENVVVGGQPVALEPVAQIDVELALGDRIAGVLGRIGGQVGQLDALGHRVEVERRIVDEGIDRAFDRDRAVLGQRRAHVDRCGLGGFGAERADGAVDLRQLRRVVGRDEVVGVGDLSILELDLAEVQAHRSGIGRRRRGVERTRLGFRPLRGGLGILPGVLGENVAQVQPPLFVQQHMPVEVRDDTTRAVSKSTPAAAS